MQFDTVIKGGTIVTATKTYKADIGISQEKIVAIDPNLTATNTQVIDAQDKYVFPGGIDVHTHLDLSIPTPSGNIVTKDNFASGTIAAACGGTTTIIDHCFQEQGQSLATALQIWHAKAKDKAAIDYGFHIGISDLNSSVLDEMSTLIKSGYPSYKVYMAYNFHLNDEEILQTLEQAKKHGGLICVHAENFYMIRYLVNKFNQEGKNSISYYPLSAPPLAEGEATYRVIQLAALVDAPLYIVHVTCKESLAAISAARQNGLKIMGETCPQYLLLSQDNYNLPDFAGAKYILGPPLRSKDNHDILWQELVKENLATVATDHCSFDFHGQKDTSKNNFSAIPKGLPGIELRMPLLFDRGVNTGKISLEKFVAITATNPAKIFGLYPQKGTIALGSDADLVIFDQAREVTINQSILHENVDYTPYADFKIKGYPIATLSRGKIIMQDGKFLGKCGAGKFLPRNKIEVL